MKAFDFNRMDQRMRNWGSWASSDNGGRGICASAEHFYVPPKLGEGEEAVHRTVMTLDVVDAERIERAVCLIPRGQLRTFVIDIYVRRYNRVKLCERARITQDLLESYHCRALMLVADCLVRVAEREEASTKRLRWPIARIATGGV